MNHHQSSITCLPALRENQTHPHRVGFSFLRALRAGLPPSAPSAPSESMGGGSPLQPEASEVEQRGQRGKGDSRARGREALEFLSRAAGSRTTEKTQGFAKNQRRFRGGLGEMTTPARPSAATLLSLSTCIFGCIFACISRCIVS